MRIHSRRSRRRCLGTDRVLVALIDGDEADEVKDNRRDSHNEILERVAEVLVEEVAS